MLRGIDTNEPNFMLNQGNNRDFTLVPSPLWIMLGRGLGTDGDYDGTVNGGDGDGDGYWPKPWQPLHTTDYVMLALSAVHQVFMLAVVVHLVWRRDWPPYVTKNVNLVRLDGFVFVLSDL